MKQKGRPLRDKRTETERREQRLRDSAAIRGIPLEQLKAEIKAFQQTKFSEDGQ